ncbi:hypothetical protein EXM22_17580 [Oceanispirochaeta crateris]|uniref:Uncharacterized protein n=1 Tax=Oceanispirochaeta crateris TaxID=2518645 RepID=A0A5C1QTS0_9SPIO|nr:hypothetical protein EXM22_17580 [Oceanispirochaeta crateris]
MTINELKTINGMVTLTANC